MRPAFIRDIDVAASTYRRRAERTRVAAIIADDSGLEIDALDGRPGIYSARYAGEGSTQNALISKVLGEMQAIPAEKRNCNFTCAMVLILPDGSEKSALGRCYGRIAFDARGTNGFGYDPIFLTQESGYQKTMSELDDETKNKLSHRRNALDGIRHELS